MNKQKALKNEGITVIKEFSVLETNKVAAIISEKICASFPEYSINKSDLFRALSRIHMYSADFTDNSAAKYYYKDDSIYFKKDMDFNQIETPALHECLHYIQSIKNKNGKLKRLGLYELGSFKSTGLALNEAAVQLMASQATNSKKDSVKYYGLEFTSDSPNYYPIECALVKQMAYFTGTYPLYHSTIYSNDIFKNTFIMKSSEKTFNKISSNLDSIVKYEEMLHEANSYMVECNSNSDQLKNIQTNINYLKNTIKDLTIQTQNLILTNCAYSDLDLVRDNQSVREFKNKLYKFQKHLILAEGDNFYNEFYRKMMEELDVKREMIKKYGVFATFKDVRENLALIETRQEPLNIFKVAIQKLKQVLHLNQEEHEKVIQKNK